MTRYFFFLSFFILIFSACNDDEQLNVQTNLVSDASFENTNNGLDLLPEGWENCGTLLPDVFPVSANSRNVDKPAFDGTNYVGLRVNENNEYGCISYLFEEAITTQDSLAISISLARSSTYLIEKAGEMINFATPIKLHIWGITNEQDVLLYESPLIVNTRWLTKSKTTAINATIKGVKLKATYQTPTPFPYNGNLLIDNLDFRLK